MGTFPQMQYALLAAYLPTAVLPKASHISWNRRQGDLTRVHWGQADGVGTVVA